MRLPLPSLPLVLGLLCLLGLPASPPASAVVIASGDGTGNTGPPPDDPGFANVGVSDNGLSGVYLGNRWVLTAAHVGERAFRFDGVWYGAVAGSRRILEEGGVQADLAMIKLAWPPPPLPDVPLASAPIAVDEHVTMIGNGWTRAATPTCWSSMWAVLSCPGGVYEGYEQAGGRIPRWGENRVTAVGTDLVIGSRTTRAFETDFDASGEVHEAVVVSGDSGGASFAERGGQWELVGIHFAQGVFGGQPTQTAVFGNVTYDVDVHHYRDEIEALFALPLGVPALPGLAPWLGAGALLAVARVRLSRARRSPSSL